MGKDAKPGFLLYHSDLHLLESLTDGEFRAVILALLSLSETGQDTAPAGAAGMAYRFMAQKVMVDAKTYKQIGEKRRSSVQSRWSKDPEQEAAQDGTQGDTLPGALKTSDSNVYIAIQTDTNDTNVSDVSGAIQTDTNDTNVPFVSPRVQTDTNDTIEHNRNRNEMKGNEIKEDEEDTRVRAREDPPREDLLDPGKVDGLSQYLANNLLPMSPGNWEALNEIMSQGIDAALVRYAVDVALAHGARVWAYVQSVLNRWIVSGVRTVEQARAQSGARKDKAAASGPGNAAAAFAALADKYAKEQNGEAKTIDQGGDGNSFARYCVGLSQIPLGEF